mgnify:CR=1 FL=1
MWSFSIRANRPWYDPEDPYGALSNYSGKSTKSIPSTGKYAKNKQNIDDWLTLRPEFTHDQISWDLKPSLFLRRAILEMEKMPGRELDLIARNDPDVYEVFVRIGGIHPRDTASSGAAGTSSAAEEVPVYSSGASSSGPASGSSGGSASCSS